MDAKIFRPIRYDFVERLTYISFYWLSIRKRKRAQCLELITDTMTLLLIRTKKQNQSERLAIA